MSGKKKKYVPHNFESLKGEGDTSSNLFMSMSMSLAWKKATPRAQMLYINMKHMQFGNTKHDKDKFDAAYRNDNRYFTFSEKKWLKGYEKGFEMYSDKRAFYKDVEILIGLGFIDCIEVGCNTRTKNLYRFSERWRLYGTPQFSVPEKYKTEAMRGTKKESRAEAIESKEVLSNAKRKEKLGV